MSGRAYRDAVRELDEALACDTLEREDRERLLAIWHAADMRAALPLIHAYYQDRDRADRTPRSFLYLHLGVVVALVEKIIEEVDRK
jgi:hypothetical protein